jgi:cell division protein FtsL
MAVAARRLDPAAAAVAAPAPAVPARRRDADVRSAPVRAARRRGRARSGPRIGRSVVWIAVVGTLLAGIVALNVAVLQLRIQRGRIGSEIAKIEAENGGLRAELSTARAVGRVESIARSQLGLVESADRIYLKLRPASR